VLKVPLNTNDPTNLLAGQVEACKVLSIQS